MGVKQQGWQPSGVCSDMKGTDLGLANLEILIVAVDDGIFWAAGPDETDALRSIQTNREI